MQIVRSPTQNWPAAVEGPNLSLNVSVELNLDLNANAKKSATNTKRILVRSRAQLETETETETAQFGPVASRSARAREPKRTKNGNIFLLGQLFATKQANFLIVQIGKKSSKRAPPFAYEFGVWLELLRPTLTVAAGRKFECGAAFAGQKRAARKRPQKLVPFARQSPSLMRAN